MSFPSLDWSRGLITHEAGEPGTWGDTHGWSKFIGATGVELWAGTSVAKVLKAPSSVLAKPNVSDAKLQNYVDNLYKGTTNPTRVGTGTTADAVRAELATGQATAGKFHMQKAEETIRGLQRWLRNNPNASYHDRLVAQSLLDDLLDALRRSK